VLTPRVNNAQAGSPVVENYPKQALQPKIIPQVAVRGLNKIISTRATTVLNGAKNIEKATSSPTKLVSNNNNINDSNNNNNNINGVRF
jgi:hypothetical protein